MYGVQRSANKFAAGLHDSLYATVRACAGINRQGEGGQRAATADLGGRGRRRARVGDDVGIRNIRLPSGSRPLLHGTGFAGNVEKSRKARRQAPAASTRPSLDGLFNAQVVFCGRLSAIEGANWPHVANAQRPTP
jgi:hypothetical protein